MVGQGLQGEPATAEIAKQYRISHGYQPGWTVVYDPNFVTLDSIVRDKAGAIPQQILLDQDRILRFAGPTSSYLTEPQTLLLQILAGQGIQP